MTKEYQSALDYLMGFVNYERTQYPHYPGQFRLDRVEALLSLCNNPQKDYKTIHIAGTKGKGSTAAITASILKDAGYRVGLYSSPHLVDFRERIQVDLMMTPKADIVAGVDYLKPRIDEINKFQEKWGELTFFEVWTVLAFVIFSRMKVEYAVIEVGMGGRLDATNVIRPEVSVIAPVSKDHSNALGETLEEIAGEKAGIIKAGVPVLIGKQEPHIYEVLLGHAKKKNAPTFIPADFLVINGKNGRDGKADLDIEFRSGLNFSVGFPLVGRHQVDNAALAVSTVVLLNKEGTRLTLDNIARGLQKAHWPGRFQVAGQHPTVVLDCAHNPAAIDKLVNTLKSVYPGRKIIFVVGFSKGKGIAEMADSLLKAAESIYVTKVDMHRAEEIETIMPFFKDSPNVTPENDLKSALASAKNTAAKDSIICITGSIYLVGHAFQILDITPFK